MYIRHTDLVTGWLCYNWSMFQNFYNNFFLRILSSMMSSHYYLSVLLVVMYCVSGYGSNNGRHFTRQADWAIRVTGGIEAASRLAELNGYKFIGKVGQLEDVYHYSSPNTRSFRKSMRQLRKDNKVGFVLKQKLKHLDKREYTVPEDPLWPRQWQLHGDTDRNNNVQKAWLQGVSGDGVTVAIVDDGLQYSHPDLSRNYASKLSFDFVNRDTDPTPRFSLYSIQTHGTKCAGIVGMAKDNSKCGVGVAYDSKIAGIRLLNDHGTTDLQEANALNHEYNDIDIYSNSYGPSDGGFTTDGPGFLAKLALENGVKKGRDGKGSIYVWASGNGGDNGDSCAADGYVNSIYTIAVGSADRNGLPAWYDEQCSAKLVVAFNQDSNSGTHMSTTSGKSGCSSSFTGTSAACPLVSGVIALALQANPNLTWRDVQYLLVYTANSDALMSRPGLWFTNGAGLRVSPYFGFGAVNAEAVVVRAKHWSNVPQQLVTEINEHNEGIASNVSSYSIFYEVSSSTRNTTDTPLFDTPLFDTPLHRTNITYLEHVVVTMTLRLSFPDTVPEYGYDSYYNSIHGNLEQDVISHEYARRGDIRVTLRSPQGTTSEILPHRRKDFINTEGYIDWRFMSVHFWGENPVGEWELMISYGSDVGTVTVSNVSMKLYGTETTPLSVRQTLSECNDSKQCSQRCSIHGDGVVCDTCKNKRVQSSLDCVTECDEGVREISGYCMDEEISNITNTSTVTSIRDDGSQRDNVVSPTSTQSYGTVSSTHFPILETDNYLSSVTSVSVTASNGPPLFKERDDYKSSASTINDSTHFLLLMILVMTMTIHLI